MDIAGLAETLPRADRTDYAEELKQLTKLWAPSKEESSEVRWRDFCTFSNDHQKAQLLQLVLSLAEVARESGRSELANLCESLQILLRRHLALDSEAILKLLQFATAFDPLDWKLVPVGGILSAVERESLLEGPSDAVRERLQALATLLAANAGKPPASLKTLIGRVDKLLSDSVVTMLKPDEGWADQLVADLSGLPDEARSRWETLLRQCLKVAPEPPATTWHVGWDDLDVDVMDPLAQRRVAERTLDRHRGQAWSEGTRRCLADVGDEEFLRRLTGWLDRVPKSKPGYLSRESPNREILRGFLWALPDCGGSLPCRELGVAADFLYKHNSALGTACVVVLSYIAAEEALTALTVLSGRVKSSSHQLLTQIARERVAARLGRSMEDLEDSSIPASGFTELGRRQAVLAGFGAEVVIRNQTAELKWTKPNGQPQASIPAAVKRDFADELKDLRHSAKEVETTLSSLASRFEAAPLKQRRWSFADWSARLLDHPIAGTVVRRMIWELTDDVTQSGVWQDSGFVDAGGQKLAASDQAQIAVWHPYRHSADEILAWRKWLDANGVTQPFKQAHREIYLLTDAERNTNTYSNRFAAHVLKQTQFRVLAKARGWTADYLGPWDMGDNGVAKWNSPVWNLRAELWFNPAGDDATTAGGYFYVATDQVRFYRPADAEDPLPLAEVPPLVLSEVFRDVDLFVGVASVGNDPQWQDGGPEGRHRTYWNNYAFGELTATAVTRKEVLETLIPRIHIADRCRLDGRFLIVRGTLRSYKIHLGSSNILMDPDDRYLCIVADRSSGKAEQQSLMLPFEGDRVLSLILSKALLLASDADIVDPGIKSQIVRNAER